MSCQKRLSVKNTRCELSTFTVVYTPNSDEPQFVCFWSMKSRHLVLCVSCLSPVQITQLPPLFEGKSHFPTAEASKTNPNRDAIKTEPTLTQLRRNVSAKSERHSMRRRQLPFIRRISLTLIPWVLFQKKNWEHVEGESGTGAVAFCSRLNWIFMFATLTHISQTFIWNPKACIASKFACMFYFYNMLICG